MCILRASSHESSRWKIFPIYFSKGSHAYTGVLERWYSFPFHAVALLLSLSLSLDLPWLPALVRPLFPANPSCNPQQWGNISNFPSSRHFAIPFAHQHTEDTHPPTVHWHTKNDNHPLAELIFLLTFFRFPKKTHALFVAPGFTIWHFLLGNYSTEHSWAHQPSTRSVSAHCVCFSFSHPCDHKPSNGASLPRRKISFGTHPTELHTLFAHTFAHTHTQWDACHAAFRFRCYHGRRTRDQLSGS